MISIAGRGKPQWQCTATAERDGIRLRIDNDADAEFWMEIRLDSDELSRLLNARLELVVNANGNDKSTVVALAHAMCERITRDLIAAEVTHDK